jgi:hypothetical protein
VFNDGRFSLSDKPADEYLTLIVTPPPMSAYWRTAAL